MRALILAAGRGARLDPLTRDRPKPLLEVGGRPILVRCLERLRSFGPTEIVIVVGWRGDRIVSELGTSWHGIPLTYRRQRAPLGLAHAIAVGAEGFGEPFLVMHGDAVFHPRAELTPVVDRFHDASEFHDTSKRGDSGQPSPGAGGPPRVAASILTERRRPEEVSAGAVRLDRRGHVTAFAAHPSPGERRWGRVAAGFYIFCPVVAHACRSVEPSSQGERELPDALGSLLERGWSILGTDLGAPRVNVNTPADLARAERLVQRSPDP